MEPSEILGGAEECHSSESGWTMYIGDTADDDATLASETDDSMASDASSGPTHQGPQLEGRFRSKHGEDGRHCYSDKKARKSSVGKQKLEMKMKQDKEEKQEMSFKTKESSTRSPSGSPSTARINMGLGK
ncbi:hypothetical protein V6N13_072549 [Hibiscus sabdariffa]|uniref:Uncharacterized protein n=1 Tax=Hibiscus sabdariffa TaxID=183260 RepID=A0ABR2R7W1_9ROSI